MADFTKQILDVSRTLSTFVDEAKKSNKNLEDINKSLNTLIKDGFGKATSKLESISDSLGEQSDKLSGGLEFDQAEFQKFLKENLSENQTKSIEKIISSFSKAGEKSNSPLGDLSKLGGILGSFRKGGSVNKSGDYLVGENGPEIVKLDEGSTVIPLNIKDILDNFKNVKRDYSLDWVKDGVANLEKANGSYFIKSDSGKYSLDRMIKATEEEIALGGAENISVGKESEYLSFLRAVLDKVEKTPEAKAEKIVSPEKLSEKEFPKKESPETSKTEKEEKEEKARKTLFGKRNEKEEIESKAEKISREEKLLEAEGAKEKTRLISEANKEKIREKSANVLSGASKLVSSTGEYLETPQQKKIAESLSGVLSRQSEKLSAKKGTGEVSLERKETSNQTLQSSKLELAKKSPKKEAEVKPVSPQKETIIREKTTEVSSGSKENERSNEESSRSKESPVTNQTGSDITKRDLEEIKAILVQMVSTLKGPLNTYSPMPYRPDSKRI